MKSITKTAALVAALALCVAVSVACNRIECGTGTVQEGERCVANPLVKCGSGTFLKFGECVALDVIVVTAETVTPPADTSDVTQTQGACPDPTTVQEGNDTVHVFCIAGHLRDFKGYAKLGADPGNLRIVAGFLTTLQQNASSPTCSTQAINALPANEQDARVTECNLGPAAEIKADGSFVMKNLKFKPENANDGSSLLLVVSDKRATAPEFVTAVHLVHGYTGVPKPPVTPVVNFENQSVFPITAATVDAWNTALAGTDLCAASAGNPVTPLGCFSGDILLGIVVDKTGTPLSGYQPAINDKFETVQKKTHFFNDTYDGFIDPTPTNAGNSGAFMIGTSPQLTFGYSVQLSDATGTIVLDTPQDFGGALIGVIAVIDWVKP